MGEISDNDLNVAVMRKVQDALGPHTNGAAQWLNNTPREMLEAHQAKITTLRSWAQALEGRARAAYLKWIDFYQRGLNEAYQELETGTIRLRQEKFNARLERDYAHKPEVADAIPTPPCSTSQK
jgi:hypothetical protein